MVKKTSFETARLGNKAWPGKIAKLRTRTSFTRMEVKGFKVKPRFRLMYRFRAEGNHEGAKIPNHGTGPADSTYKTPLMEANRRLGDGQMKVRKFPSVKEGESGMRTSISGLFSLNKPLRPSHCRKTRPFRRLQRDMPVESVRRGSTGRP